MKTTKKNKKRARTSNGLNRVFAYGSLKIGGERQKNTELNQQLHVLEQTLKG